MTALHYAVQGKQEDATRALLHLGADTNVKDCKQFTALQTAVVSDCSTIISMFSEQGADLYCADAEGMTLLHLASQHEAALAANTLLSYGADVNARNNKQQTPCILAMTKWLLYL